MMKLKKKKMLLVTLCAGVFLTMFSLGQTSTEAKAQPITSTNPNETLEGKLVYSTFASTCQKLWDENYYLYICGVADLVRSSNNAQLDILDENENVLQSTILTKKQNTLFPCVTIKKSSISFKFKNLKFAEAPAKIRLTVTNKSGLIVKVYTQNVIPHDLELPA